MAEAKTATKKYYLGTGRRKTSVARVRLLEGSGQIKINDRELTDFFTEDKDRNAVVGPLMLTEMANRLDVTIRVHGGKVWVEDRPGGGARFVVELPAEARSTAAGGVGVPALAEEPGLGPRREKRN